MNTTPLSNPLTVMQIIATKYRNSDHEVERQLRELIKDFIALKNNQPSQSQALDVLQQGKEQLLTLKRQLSENAIQQTKLYEVCRKRVHCQEEQSNPEVKSSEQLAGEQKDQSQMDSEIMQYLLSQGLVDKARQLQCAFQKEVLTLIFRYGLLIQSHFDAECDLFQELFQICSQIKENNLLGVRTWANQNLHMLFKLESTLEFELTCCEYLNLVRLQEINGACQCLRVNLADMRLTKEQHGIIQALTYLLVEPNKANDCLLQKHLRRTQEVFKKSFAEIYCISLDASLPRKIAIGLSALKSVCCSDEEKRNPEVCPICCGDAIRIGERIPMLTKEGSCLKCRVNGSIMDHENYPVVLPSKYIYSSSALSASEVDEQYYCAVTETYYKKEEARKVYLA